MSYYTCILNTLFVLLAIFTFLLGGIFYALLFDLAKDQGLAGGAIVLMSGFVGGGLGLVLSLVVIRRKNNNLKTVIAKILIFASLGLMGYFYWNYQTNVKLKREKSNTETHVKKTKELELPIDR